MSNLPESHFGWPLLRRDDQAVVALLVLLSLGAVAGGWWYAGGFAGHLTEIEQQPNREARFLVDVNRADWPELAQLPGIGETLARRIVESRQSDGPFESLDALDRVRGIGTEKLAAIKPFLLLVGARGEGRGARD